LPAKVRLSEQNTKQKEKKILFIVLFVIYVVSLQAIIRAKS
jgi:flagellar basal body-associated protein FliL